MYEILLNRLLVIIKRNWVTTLLFFLFVTLLVFSLQSAKWVRDEAALSTAFLIGGLLGWLLARSRFGGWFALPYALLIAVFISIEAAGKILPGFGGFFARPFAETFLQINLRIVNFSLRLSGWVETLRAGENVEDPGLFVLLLCALLALCGIWLMWAVMRERKMLLGVLPIGLLYALNVHLSRQPLMNFMVFLFCVLLLIVRTEYNRQHEEWQRRGVDYPEQLGLEWGGTALGIVLVVVLISRAAPFFGTAEGWQAISEWVNRANQETSTTATRLFSGVNPPPPQPGAEEIYVNTPNLGNIGAPISQGEKTIMWVSISDPPPPPVPPGVGSGVLAVPVRTHYWRSEIYDVYNGRGWQEVTKGVRIDGLDEIPENPPRGRYYLRQSFQMKARHSGTLFSVNDVVQTSDAVFMRQAGPEDSRLIEGTTSEYQVISSATRVSANLLATASINYSDQIRAAYLQLPGSLPARVRTLAERVAGGDENPYLKALKIQDYLRTNYEYDLDVPEAPDGRDVVDFFLFDSPGGFCSHFASSMTVMLRSVGVPSRVVTGYAMGDFDQERQAYRVPESAAHAWVEIFFPGYGWIEFEPTVARTALVYPEEGSTQDKPEPVTSLEEEPNQQARPYFIALVLVIVIVILALPIMLMRMFSTTHRAPLIQVDILYRRMRRALAWAGLTAAGSVTPDEYLAQYGESLGQYRQLNQALQHVTALYREATYGPNPPDVLRVRSASQLWRSSFREWLVLWLRQKWRALRSG